MPQTLASLKFEYKRKYSESDSEPWIAKEFAASTIQGGKLTINLPFEGEDYLMELNEYYYRISLTPEDANYRTYTFGEDTFKCKKAVITSEISAPSLSYDIVNDVPIITAVVNSAKLFYDGVSLEDYAHDYPTYQINYRAKGSDDWQITTVYKQDGVYTLKVNASTFTIGDRYEFQMAVYAGSSHNNALYSPISEITIPKEVTPDVPVVPEPPVGGDTSSIEGTWHLTEWRGATPSFEVYLDINATGGVTLYQRLESNYWEVFQSSATIENGVIWGVYTDGVAWGARYNLSVSDTTMTWVDTEDATDISIYTRSNLPTHIPTAPTRATTPQERFFSEPEQIRRIPQNQLDKDFLLEIERRVSADSVIVIDQVEYEVDFRFARQRIRLRYSPDLKDIFIVEPDNSLTPIRLLNKQENARIKREKIHLCRGDE